MSKYNKLQKNVLRGISLDDGRMVQASSAQMVELTDGSRHRLKWLQGHLDDGAAQPVTNFQIITNALFGLAVAKRYQSHDSGWMRGTVCSQQIGGRLTSTGPQGYWLFLMEGGYRATLYPRYVYRTEPFAGTTECGRALRCLLREIAYDGLLAVSDTRSATYVDESRPSIQPEEYTRIDWPRA